MRTHTAATSEEKDTTYEMNNQNRILQSDPSSKGSYARKFSLRTELIMSKATVAIIPGTQRSPGTFVLDVAMASSHTHQPAPKIPPDSPAPHF
mmetsp:Transcript_13159/g.25117  ORF Transcript_13159/g.25117 Transcript_13159/m.25117 type:complete len:93 (+) Transcript_13159:344-622(+)